MKKVVTGIVFLFLFVIVFPKSVFASQGLIPPTSGLYFLQMWGENVKLAFTFSKDQKVSYLLSLTQRRVDEMAISPSFQISDRYTAHFQDLENLAPQVSDKDQVVEKIKDASLNQQSELAVVYLKVSANAKPAVLGAQTSSSEHVANTIQAVDGQKSADNYTAQVQTIQKAEQVGKIEQVQMESGPNSSPSENNINQINNGQGLNQLNPINNPNGSAGGDQMQPTAPIPMK
ncbi:MAG: DUF5667 domain-containing protein [Candidatus Microgenomates bacterium]|jgi:hypothetical protein